LGFLTEELGAWDLESDVYSNARIRFRIDTELKPSVHGTLMKKSLVFSRRSRLGKGSPSHTSVRTVLEYSVWEESGLHKHRLVRTRTHWWPRERCPLVQRVCSWCDGRVGWIGLEQPGEITHLSHLWHTHVAVGVVTHTTRHSDTLFFARPFRRCEWGAALTHTCSRVAACPRVVVAG
jgi:hypothetical protein